MIGAIAGDIIGSVYEWHNIKTTEFPLFDPRCTYTDDTVLTIAIADAIRKAISLGGDSDTIASITGGIAEAFYGIPDAIRIRALEKLDDKLAIVVNLFARKYYPV